MGWKTHGPLHYSPLVLNMLQTESLCVAGWDIAVKERGGKRLKTTSWKRGCDAASITFQAPALPLGDLLPWLWADAPRDSSTLWSLLLPAATLCPMAALSMNPVVVLGTAWGYEMHPQAASPQPPPMVRANIYSRIPFTEAVLNAVLPPCHDSCGPVIAPKNPSRSVKLSLWVWVGYSWFYHGLSTRTAWQKPQPSGHTDTIGALFGAQLHKGPLQAAREGGALQGEVMLWP